MNKLVGLLAFAVALAAAVVLTKYYSTPSAQKQPQSAPVITAATPAVPPDGGGANVPVTFKTQLVTLDFAAKKAHVTLDLERDPARPAPEKVWVWAYFFTPDAPGRYCSGEPVEVRQPFMSGSRASVTADFQLSDCPAPRTSSSTYYARANVSAESAFAARLGEQRISYDITQASPATVEGTQAKKH
jgi:hypothetical protein